MKSVGFEESAADPAQPVGASSLRRTGPAQQPARHGLVRPVHRRGPQLVEPRAQVLRARRGERAARDAFGVQPAGGARCGEFCPTGSAPLAASLENVLPNPVWYLSFMT